MGLDDKIAQARAAGASWDQINRAIGQRVAAARAAGAADEQIVKAFGPTASPEQVQAVVGQLHQHAQENLAAQPDVQAKVVTDPVGAFGAGLQASSGGLMARGKLPSVVTADHVGMFTRLAREAGEFTGDIPAMVTGALGGGTVGAGAGGTAGAAVPVAGETGVSEAAGAVTGAVVAGGAGSMALPQFIKSAYIDGLKNGSWKTPEDFAARTAGVLWDTTKAGAVGAATSLVGGKVGEALGKSAVALNPWAKLGIKTTAELTTMTSVAAGLNGRLPTSQDFLDGAALLAFFHVAGAGAGAAKGVVGNAKENLQNHWADTEQHPVAAAHEAINDPIARTKMLNAPEPAIHPLAPQHATDSGTFVLGHIPSSFDTDVKFMIDKQEGGGRVITDTGGATKWGISAKGNPDIDIKNLSREDAQRIYHDRYWKPIGAGNIQDPALRRAAFDSAVNEGVGPTKEWLAQSKGDLQKFLALRTEKYRQLLDSQPEKYGKYENAWNARLERLGATTTIRGMAEHMEVAGGAGEPPAPPETPAAEPEDNRTPEERVKATMGDFDAPGPKSSAWDWIKDKAGSIYRELWSPDHPINKLVDAAQGKGDLPDFENPRVLNRMAELSPTISHYIVERNMVDTEGNVTGKGLKDIVGDLKGAGLQDFLTYARSRWGQEQAAQGKKTPNDVMDYNAVVEAGRKAHEERYQELVGWRNGTMAYLRDSGVLSEAAYQKALAEGSGIPGYRLQESGSTAAGGASKGRMSFNPLKRSEGSKERTQDIMGSLLKEAFQRVELGRRNAANLALVDLAEKMGLGTKVDASRLVKINVTDAELMKATDDAGGIDTDGEGLDIYRRLGAQLKDNQIPVLRDGKMEAWEFEDPEIARYVRGLDRVSQGTLGRLVAGITKFQRNMIVMSPDFPLRLLQYDVPWQFITKPGFRNTLMGSVVGLHGIFAEPEKYDQWLRSGGAEGVFAYVSKDDYIKEVLKGNEDKSFADGAWNTLHTGFHALRSWGQMLSQAPRFGRFIQGLDEGETPAMAGVASSDAAFHRPGFGGSWSKNVNAVIPFFNAYLNSMEQVVRGQFGIGRTITGEKYNAAQFSAKAAAIITLPMLATWFLNKDQDWYKAAPDWQKDNGLLFRVGDNTIFFKYPPVLSFLYGGLPRRVMEAFGHDNPHALDDIGKSIGTSFLPGGFAPALLMPIIEHVANYSFFKEHPLVPDDVKRSAMAPEQFNQYSSDTARHLSRFFSDVPLLKDFKLSPPVIDNYIQAWGGSLGEEAMRAAEMAYHAAAGDRPSPTLSEMPLLKSWLARYPSASAQPINDFRARMDDFNAVHGSMVKLVESGDLDRFKQLAEKNPTAAVIHAYKMRNEPTPSNVQDFANVLAQAGQTANRNAAETIIGTEKALQRLDMVAKFVYANEKMTPRDKRQMLDQAYGQMQVISEQGLKAMDAMEQSKPVPKLNLQALGASLPTPPRNQPTLPPPGVNRGQAPVS